MTSARAACRRRSISTEAIAAWSSFGPFLKRTFVIPNPALRASGGIDLAFERFEALRRANTVLDALGSTISRDRDERRRQVRHGRTAAVRHICVSLSHGGADGWRVPYRHISARANIGVSNHPPKRRAFLDISTSRRTLASGCSRCSARLATHTGRAQFHGTSWTAPSASPLAIFFALAILGTIGLALTRLLDDRPEAITW